jgi:ATP-dependent exoDNAse (exonuclease V) alpha subunit
MQSISRASGLTAPGAAAYRAGERIRDERTGQLYDYSRRGDVLHAEITLPSALEATAPDWVRQRASLWNGAEAVERQRNARVAREYEVALPAELSVTQRLALARAFSRELADRYRVIVDLAVHAPRAAGDPRNFHAHLLTTTRELTATGLGAKAQSEWSGTKRFQQGLTTSRLELTAVRERWAVLTNEALKAAGLNLRIDHRSLAAQGIDREPKPRIPYVAIQIERRGMRSEVAERIREQYQARVMARQNAAAPSQPPVDLEQRQRLAREAWLQLRRNSLLGLDSKPPAAPGIAVSRQSEFETRDAVDAARKHTRDRDFSL